MTNIDLETESPQALRSRRLAQISAMVIAVSSVALVAYMLKGDWSVAAAICCNILTMLVARRLSHRGRTELASMILLGGLTLVVSALMWISEGLHDVVMLTYPVVLIMAGLLVSRRYLFVLLGFMLVYVVAITLATDVLGWRVDGEPSSGLELARDALLILVASGFSVWVIVNDLNLSHARLLVQIERFHESQKHLTYLSQHDSLTGLANRSMGRDRIVQAITQAERDQTCVALLFVDLDNFKAINDTLGHSVGDDYLRQVATRLGQAVRKSDVVCRHGGDEFIIGLTDVVDVQDVSAIAQTVMDSLAAPFAAKAHEIVSSCSIGIALYPDDGPDYETLLRLADISMYQAKEAGRNAYRFYDAEMNANMQQTLLLVTELRSAIARKEFVLHYQPVMHLASGDLVGAEALVRWQHPVKGLVSPAVFIPAAEKSGLIVELGEWVLAEACRQLAAWRDRGCPEIFIAVNLSPVQFRRGNIEVIVQSALEASRLPAHCLELEITESTLVQDAGKFMVSLQALKALGVHISIDDFGTGYSNLSYLQRFAVDKLKVDQSFVRHLLRGPQDRALVLAIIQMARSLNLRTTAEGIEDAAVRQELENLGCDQGQGYFFARPLTAEAFFALMQKIRQA